MAHIWKLAAIGFAALITWLSLQPATGVQSLTQADKLQHFIAYGVLCALVGLGWPKLSLVWCVVLVAVFGGSIEVAQGLGESGRTPSSLDATANFFGAIIAALGLRVLRK